jgi:hypothetical protein
VNDHSKGSILVCEECGQRTVLDGPLSAWSSGGSTFACECGERLTLAEGLDQRGFGQVGGARSAAPPTWPPYP